MLEKNKLKIPAINFKLLLIIIFVLIGMIPAFIYSKVYTQYFKQGIVEGRKNELRTYTQILSDKLTRSGYLKDNMGGLDSEVALLADIYDGRIVILDKSFRIVKDTFNIAEGRISIAEEVIKCFQGENIIKYHSNKNYIVHTVAIYDNSENKNIDGVMIVTSSTEDIEDLINTVKDKFIVFEIMIFFMLLVVSFLISSFIEKPFSQLAEALSNVVAGDTDHSIKEESYSITKQISTTINSALDRLKSIDQSRDEFVANVSHELKTPITSIRVLADSLIAMEDAPVELYKEFMNDISDEIDRESKIIDDLLSLVKLDKSALDLNTEQVNINVLLKQILKMLRPIAAKRNIEIIFESIREVKAEVDETKLSLALNNLVENAIKYNKEDGWVRVTLDADHKFFYVKIADSGVGIADEFQESIFERFYRIDKARSRATGGTGLGLAITKNIISGHRGIIKVSSKEGEGTVFTVRLPLTYISRDKNFK